MAGELENIPNRADKGRVESKGRWTRMGERRGGSAGGITE